MKRKKAGCSLTAAALILSLAGCAGGSGAPSSPQSGSAPAPESPPAATLPESPAPGSAPAPGEKVKIVWSVGQSTTGGRKAVADAFNRSRDDIEIELVEQVADATAVHDMYVTSFAAGANDYDLIGSNVPWPAEFSQAGYAMALDRFIEKDNFNLDDYFPGYIDAYTFQGQLWGLPTWGNVAVLFYRSDIVQTPPATWDELLAMAREGMGKKDAKYGYLMQGAQYEGLACNATDMIAAYGGAVTDGDGNIVVNSQGTIDALTMLQSFVTAGIMPQDVTTHKEANSTDLFAAGEAVFMRNWPAQWTALNDPEKSKVVGNVSFCPLPAGPARPAAILGGWGTIMYSGTRHPEEAWEAMKFICGPEGQKLIGLNDGEMPTLIPLYEDAELLEANPVFDGLVEAAQNAVTRPVTPIYNQISEIMQIEISGVLVGSATPADAAASMQAKMERAARDNAE